jgi:hypothetical protein
MILPHETEIRCEWTMKGGKVTGSADCDRIQLLIRSYLKKLGADDSGWDFLYQDPRDGRLWELIYPFSEMHGGGPPLLKLISIQEARKKYRLQL